MVYTVYWINNHYSVNLEYLGAGISSLLLYTWDKSKCLSPNIRVYTKNTFSKDYGFFLVGDVLLGRCLLESSN
jgi:hypothetical protein